MQLLFHISKLEYYLSRVIIFDKITSVIIFDKITYTIYKLFTYIYYLILKYVNELKSYFKNFAKYHL